VVNLSSVTIVDEAGSAYIINLLINKWMYITTKYARNMIFYELFGLIIQLIANR
jgi:hypothetical protein